LENGTKIANALRRDAARPSAFARRAAHAGDVGAGGSDQWQIIGRELAGQRDDETMGVRAVDPRGERAPVEQSCQPETVFISRVEEHATNANARGDINQRRRYDVRARITVRVCDKDDRAGSGAGNSAALRGRRE